MRIYLTGMPGCGKSTFGKKVAQALNLKFIDLDKEIINEEDMPIAEIFETRGEDHFREVESRLLKDISVSNKEFIMATGGGAPCFFDNMDFMNEQGETIYIDTPIDILMERLSASGILKRPLIRKMDQNNLREELEEQLNHRLPHYRKAKRIFHYNAALDTDIIQYYHRG